MKTLKIPEHVLDHQLISINEDDIQIGNDLNTKDLNLLEKIKSVSGNKELDYDTHKDVK